MADFPSRPLDGLDVGGTVDTPPIDTNRVSIGILNVEHTTVGQGRPWRLGTVKLVRP